jgi:TPR repeat protein
LAQTPPPEVKDSATSDQTVTAPPVEQTPPPSAKKDKVISPWVPGDQKRFNDGLAAYDAHNYERAYKIFKELADHEDLGAMRNVAYMQRKGLGTEKDPQAALDLYEFIARAGLPTAQFDYGEMLLDGEAGDPDPEHAIPWLKLAAKSGHPVAQYRLGLLYEEGVAVPKNLFTAELYYSAAAEHGSHKALERLSALKGWPAPPEKAPQSETQPGVPGLQTLEPDAPPPGSQQTPAETPPSRP